MLPLVIFVSVIVACFVITYVLNEKTAAPEVDADLDLGGCAGCHSLGCGHHPARRIKREEHE